MVFIMILALECQPTSLHSLRCAASLPVQVFLVGLITDNNQYSVFKNVDNVFSRGFMFCGLLQSSMTISGDLEPTSLECSTALYVHVYTCSNSMPCSCPIGSLPASDCDCM